MEGPNVGEKAHLVDSLHDGVHRLILVRLQDDGRVADPEGDAAKAVLDDAAVNVVDGHDGHNVAVAAVAAALHLAIQLQPQMVPELRAQVLWLQRDRVFKLLLRARVRKGTATVTTSRCAGQGRAYQKKHAAPGVPWPQGSVGEGSRSRRAATPGLALVCLGSKRGRGGRDSRRQVVAGVPAIDCCRVEAAMPISVWGARLSPQLALPNIETTLHPYKCEFPIPPMPYPINLLDTAGNLAGLRR